MQVVTTEKTCTKKTENFTENKTNQSPTWCMKLKIENKLKSKANKAKVLGYQGKDLNSRSLLVA